MTAFAPGGRLWTRRSGYSSYSLFLRLRPRRRNRRPCITFGSLRSGLLFGLIVARPHRHHGPSRSHLSHRPGWNRRFHPPCQIETARPSIYVSSVRPSRQRSLSSYSSIFFFPLVAVAAFFFFFFLFFFFFFCFFFFFFFC